MRYNFFILATMAMTSTACSITDKAGITRRFESSEETTVESPQGSWNGLPIFISNTNGSVQVVGVEGKTNISVHARLVAGANSQADADAAFPDVASTIVVEEQDGLWTIDCDLAKEWHGSVDPNSTGCTSLRVEVPAGSLDAPLAIDGYLPFGGFHVSNVTTKRLKLTAPFGIKADVKPTLNAEIYLWGADLGSGLCSNVLRLPPDVTFEIAELSVDRPNVKFVDVPEDDPKYWLGTFIEGFDGAPMIPPRTASYTWTRQGMPASTTHITVRASIGKAVLTTGPLPTYGKIHQCERYEL
jgi:hypothetical protein